MPSFEVSKDGVSYTVDVPDTFLKLPQEQQDAELGKAFSSLGGGAQAPRQPAQPDVENQLGAGVSDIGRGFAATGRRLGLSNEPTPAEAPDTGPNAVGEVVEGVRNLDWRRVRDNAGPALARVAPDVAAGVAAAGAGALVGGPVGALVGGGLYAAGRSFGDNVEARARNNRSVGPDGNLAPTTGDYVGGAAATAVDATLGAVGSAGLNTTRRALGAASAPATGFLGRTGSAAANAGTEAATGAVSDVANQALTSVGTESGLSVDPVQSVVAGGLEGTARASMGIPGAAVRGGLETAARVGGENAMGEMSVDRAASVERVNAALERRRANTDQDAPVENHLNGLRTEVEANLHNTIRAAEKAGWIDESTYREMRSLFEEARRHNKSLAEGEGDTDDVNAYGLSILDTLNAPEEFKAEVRSGLVDLDTLATASRKKNLTGGFEKAGDLLGRVGSVATGAYLGGPTGFLGGLAAGVVANPIGARVGAAVGRGLDNAFGTRAPAVILARQKAQGILEAAGRTDVGDSYQVLKKAQDALGDAELSDRYAMGLPTDPESVARARAEVARRRAAVSSPEVSEIPQQAAVPPGADAPPPQPGPPPAAPLASPPPAADPPPMRADYSARVLPGWASGIRSFVQSKGVIVPEGEAFAKLVKQAVDDLEGGGHLAPDMATAIRGSDGGIAKNAQRVITARVGELLGVPNLHDMPGVSYTAPSGSPIRDPQRWQSAADARQSYITQALAESREADPGMAQTLGVFQLLPDSKMSPANKVEMARATIAAAKDDATRARREAVLKPLIELYRKD